MKWPCRLNEPWALLFCVVAVAALVDGHVIAVRDEDLREIATGALEQRSAADKNMMVLFEEDEEELETGEGGWRLLLGTFFGMVASTSFTVQYLPQAVLNYRRKSVKGFSSNSIVIKYIGACFLFVNCALMGERLPVTLYGACNVLQHAVFLVQFAVYQHPRRLAFLAWLCFPFVPMTGGVAWPASIAATNLVKPLCQVLSHVPQLQMCVRMKTTAGLSLMTQHLNVIGGLAGLVMCQLTPPTSSMTVMLYINSLLQAVTVYICALRYDGIAAFTGKKQSNLRQTTTSLIQYSFVFHLFHLFSLI